MIIKFEKRALSRLSRFLLFKSAIFSRWNYKSRAIRLISFRVKLIFKRDRYGSSSRTSLLRKQIETLCASSSTPSHSHLCTFGMTRVEISFGNCSIPAVTRSKKERQGMARKILKTGTCKSKLRGSRV